MGTGIPAAAVLPAGSAFGFGRWRCVPIHCRQSPRPAAQRLAESRPAEGGRRARFWPQAQEERQMAERGDRGGSGGFGAAAVSVWDKINDTKADIQKVEATVQEAKAGIYKDISDAARGVTQEIGGVAKDVAGVGKEILNNRFATERGLC